MDYGRIVKRALDITWRHKILWAFGIAAAFFGGGAPGRSSGGGRGPSLQYVFSGADFERWTQTCPLMPPEFPGQGAFPSWEALAPIVASIAAVVLLVALVAAIVGVIVRYTSLGALVGMVDEVERTENTSFKSGLQKGWSRFLRLFAINLIIGLATFVIVMVLIFLMIGGILLAATPAILLSEAGTGPGVAGILFAVAVGLVLLLLLILVSLALGAAVTLVREFAFRACVIDGKGVFEALGAGTALVRSRPREAVLMWLLMVAINIALGLLTIPLALLGAGGILGAPLLTFATTRSVLAAIGVALPFLLVIGLAGMVVGGIYLTFRSAVWTLTYRELRADEALAETA